MLAQREVSSDASLPRMAEELHGSRGSVGAAEMTESLPAAGVGNELHVARPDQLEGSAIEAIESLVRDGFDVPFNAQ